MYIYIHIHTHVAVCFSVLQCVAVRCSVLQPHTTNMQVCLSSGVLQCIAAFHSVL